MVGSLKFSAGIVAAALFAFGLPSCQPDPQKSDAGNIKVSGAELNTKVSVKRGQQLVINASGSIDFGGPTHVTAGPDGSGGYPPDNGYPAPNLKWNSLIFKIGPGGRFLQGGQSVTEIAAEDGEVWVEANDCCYSDNKGYWTVGITVTDIPTNKDVTGNDGQKYYQGKFHVSVDRNPALLVDDNIMAGSTVQVTAQGQIDVGTLGGNKGPDGDKPVLAWGNIGATYPYISAYKNSLIAHMHGSFGDDWYQAGSARKFVVRHSGKLEFQINDFAPGDNGGSWDVTGQVDPPPGDVQGGQGEKYVDSYQVSGLYRTGFHVNGQSMKIRIHADGWADMGNSNVRDPKGYDSNQHDAGVAPNIDLIAAWPFPGARTYELIWGVNGHIQQDGLNGDGDGTYVLGGGNELLLDANDNVQRDNNGVKWDVSVFIVGPSSGF